MSTPQPSQTNPRSTWYQIRTNLSFYVLIAIAAGILLGYFYPATAIKMEVVGKRFVDGIKLFIVPIIFLTIVLGISSIGDLRKVGRIGIKSLLYFEIVTTLALGIGIMVAILLEPGKIDRTGLAIQDASKYTSQAGASFDWLQFLKANTTLQVLILAII
ncbi:MAG: cation:dicarboxylase symporter family transporter, partial [Bacteroidota bacterium]